METINILVAQLRELMVSLSQRELVYLIEALTKLSKTAKAMVTETFTYVLNRDRIPLSTQLKYYERTGQRMVTFYRSRLYITVHDDKTNVDLDVRLWTDQSGNDTGWDVLARPEDFELKFTDTNGRKFGVIDLSHVPQWDPDPRDPVLIEVVREDLEPDSAVGIVEIPLWAESCPTHFDDCLEVPNN